MRCTDFVEAVTMFFSFPFPPLDFSFMTCRLEVNTATARSPPPRCLCSLDPSVASYVSDCDVSMFYFDLVLNVACLSAKHRSLRVGVVHDLR